MNNLLAKIHMETNWVGPKFPLVFLSKTKRHIFHFHQELY